MFPILFGSMRGQVIIGLMDVRVKVQMHPVRLISGIELT